MLKRDETRQELILGALAPELGADSAAVDQLRPWERLAAHITPLIGDAGFCALYGRVVRLTAPEYKWIIAIPSNQSIDALFLSLRGNFASVDVPTATKANKTLLDTYTGLLSTLIGEALTTRLLIAAWRNESDGKNTQEISK